DRPSRGRRSRPEVPERRGRAGDGAGVGRAQARRSRAGERRARRGGERDGGRVSGLRRGRRAAARAHAGEVARGDSSMSDRNRNSFVLLIVALLIGVAAVTIVAKKTRLGLDLKG